jgi:hypothetical protein
MLAENKMSSMKNKKYSEFTNDDKKMINKFQGLLSKFPPVSSELEVLKITEKRKVFLTIARKKSNDGLRGCSNDSVQSNLPVTGPNPFCACEPFGGETRHRWGSLGHERIFHGG